MTARYRFPDALGGGEHDAAEDDPNYPRVAFDLGLVERHWIHREDLTPLAPPEPPLGSVVLVGVDPDHDARSGLVSGLTYRRYGAGWGEPGGDAYEFHTWANICARRAPVLLVPDPLAEAPELPWTSEGAEMYVNTHTPDGTGVWVSVDGTEVLVSPSTAHQAGLALLRAAAEQAEAGRSRSCPTCHSPSLARPMPGDALGRTCTDTWHQQPIGAPI